jgi:hypothetical protein
MQVSVYTFGAPRVGNHAFARQYEAAVPDTWHVINDQVRCSLMVEYMTLITSQVRLNCAAAQQSHWGHMVLINGHDH